MVNGIPDSTTSLPSPQSKTRIAVDIIFGMILPILCFVFDPMFLKTSTSFTCGGPLLGPYTGYFVYPAVTIGIVTLLFWLINGKRLQKWGAFIAGIFWFGAFLALLLGVPLVIFGFLAWIPGFVYWRSGLDAWKLAPPTARLPTRVFHALGGVVFVLGISFLIYYFLTIWLPPVIYPACPDV